MDTNNSLKHLALVSDSGGVRFGDVTSVSAALQKQVARDFGPLWGINATVDAFQSLEQVPIDYWPIIVRDDIETPGAAGIHLDNDGQPFALVQFSDGWSLTASHEALEMLCDPSGNKVIAGPSPMEGQGRVLFLVEVCDPSEANQFAYSVNGVIVSDFYTPRYFDPVASSGVRYSFTGALTQPRQILQGGYISWHDPVSDEWFQQVHFGAAPEFRRLGPLAQDRRSIRTQIYERTPQAHEARRLSSARLSATTSRQSANVLSSAAKSKKIRAQVGELLKGKK